MTKNSGLGAVHKTSDLKRWALAASALMLSAAVSGFSGQAIYLQLKARLAQFLLLSAWEQSLENAAPVKPWPWADSYPAALLEVPDLHINQVVLNGHSGEAMAFGPGLVVANQGFVVAGHRDSHLSWLQHLQTGDALTLTLPGKAASTFEVVTSTVLDVRLVDTITPQPDSLTLITCYPFNAPFAGGPLRLIMLAKKQTQSPGHRNPESI